MYCPVLPGHPSLHPRSQKLFFMALVKHWYHIMNYIISSKLYNLIILRCIDNLKTITSLKYLPRPTHSVSSEGGIRGLVCWDTLGEIMLIYQVEVEIIDVRSFLFSNLGIQWYIFPPKYCFSSIIWNWNVFTFIYLKILTLISSLTHGLIWRFGVCIRKVLGGLILLFFLFLFSLSSFFGESTLFFHFFLFLSLSHLKRYYRAQMLSVNMPLIFIKSLISLNLSTLIIYIC